MNIMDLNGTMLVNVEEIGTEIAELFAEEFAEDKEIKYDILLMEIWQNLYKVLDAIDDVAKKELQEYGFKYNADEQVFKKEMI